LIFKGKIQKIARGYYLSLLILKGCFFPTLSQKNWHSPMGHANRIMPIICWHSPVGHAKGSVLKLETKRFRPFPWRQGNGSLRLRQLKWEGGKWEIVKTPIWTKAVSIAILDLLVMLASFNIWRGDLNWDFLDPVLIQTNSNILDQKRIKYISLYILLILFIVIYNSGTNRIYWTNLLNEKS